MTQNQRLDFLIRYLQAERPEFQALPLPDTPQAKQRLLRGLMNIRPALPIGREFLEVQDGYLSERLAQRGTTRLSDLKPIQPGLYLWRGDLTTLAADAIVNAANSQMLGCFFPCHGCIDNAIHTYAGVQLRLDCARMMAEQAAPEPTGRAKITKAYNLPCRYVLHTVGPIIYGTVTLEDRQLLAACYRSCLDLAAANDLHSVAFCCISTGEFHFPKELAAQIAVDTVKQWQRQHPDTMEVIFNVFHDADQAIYQRLLG